MADPCIGQALQLIHGQPDRPWTLRDLGQRVGLGRSAFAARFTKLVGLPMHRYPISRWMAEAAFLALKQAMRIAKNRDSSRIRNHDRVFEVICSTSWSIAGSVPGTLRADGDRQRQDISNRVAG